MNSKKSSQKQNQSNLTSSSKSKLSTFHNNQNSNIARIAPFKPREDAETSGQDRKIIRFNDDIEEISAAAEAPRHGSLFENGGENVDEDDNDRELGFDDDLEENEINLDDNDEEFQKFLNSDLAEDRLV
jgi:hypothetical protein